MLLLLSTSLLLVAVTPAFTAVTPGNQQPPSCLYGQACRHIQNRSYMNNTVFCCPNGLGLSVMSNGHSIHCACGNNNYITAEGQRMSRAMRRRMQRFQKSFQAQMAAFNRQMSNMSRNLSNMFQGGFW
ncbi:uncharacterized protein [Haliotis cracherodii]|uniref:uncharacterized protein isoform X1 n=1 Tax=Haliotis cracherodii TaxID=6455 RepID=UPI0039EAA78E